MNRKVFYKTLFSVLLMFACVALLFVAANTVERPGSKSEYTFFDWVFYAMDLKDGFGMMFLRGTGMTIFISVVGTVAGFIIGLAVGIVRTIPLPMNAGRGRRAFKKAVDWLLSVYVEVFRGTPMMVQAMIIYYGAMQAFGIDFDPLGASLIIVSINTGAYMAEIARGGIEALDRGQTEAAYALGMGHFSTMTRVVIPQVVRNILPATGNEFVINIKDTSVLNVISLSELYFATVSVKGATYRTFEAFLVSGVIYLFLTFTITRVLRLIEMKMDGGDCYERISPPETDGGVVNV